VRTFALLLAVSLAAVGCNHSTVAGRAPLPAQPLGAPGAPGTSRADLDRTIQEMESRVASKPGDASATVRLADALLRQARCSRTRAGRESRTVLRSFLARTPGGTYQYQAQRLLATALASQHRFDEAIKEAERCLQARPDDAMLYGIIGDSKLELGDREAAFSAFERMVALRPDGTSYARVAYARELNGDRDGAIRLMTMALEATSPNDVEAIAWHRAQLGALYFGSGRIDQASREFDHAIYLFAGYPLALEGQARVAHARGQHAAALALIDQLTTGTPTSSALALSAEVLRSLGAMRKRQSVTCWRKRFARRKDPRRQCLERPASGNEASFTGSRRDAASGSYCRTRGASHRERLRDHPRARRWPDRGGDYGACRIARADTGRFDD
jgi:tetratricopeptide (TPR) repeat protein